ncbi:MFS transporter [Streptomyces sp. NPDC059970]|uniref:MFS transporter n=1 Tax=Streptomyces sp. NPDC059970 TaxID=3347019 RepID=UPI00369F31FC
MSPRPSPSKWRVLVLLGTAFFMTILDGTSLLTALPAIEREFRAHGTAVHWAVTAYALAFAGLLLLCGRAADLLGRRSVFLAGMSLRVLASLGCGFAPSAEALVAARALQGVSAAIIAPAALSMVMNAFAEGAERNRALGIWGGIGGFGATAGLLLGGLITDTLGWQWVFWINVPVGAVVLVLVPVMLIESRNQARVRSLDLAGALTVTSALVLFVYAITSVPDVGWSSHHVLGPLAGAMALTGLFVVIERRSKAPLVPFGVLRSRSLVGGDLLLLVTGMAVDGMLIVLTAHAQAVLGWSPVRFGLTAGVMTVAAVVGALACQRVVTRVGVRPVATVGTALLGGACLLLTRVVSEHSSPELLTFALLVFGAGMGTATVCAQIAAFTGVAERHSGLAAGLADTCFAVGTALGVAIAGSVVAAHAPTPGTAAPQTLVPGHQAAFGVVGLVAALGAVIALAMLGKRSAPVTKETAAPPVDQIVADRMPA